MRYANITSIPSSYIVAFFSSLVLASAAKYSAAAGYKPAPQLGRLPTRFVTDPFFSLPLSIQLINVFAYD